MSNNPCITRCASSALHHQHSLLHLHVGTQNWWKNELADVCRLFPFFENLVSVSEWVSEWVWNYPCPISKLHTPHMPSQCVPVFRLNWEINNTNTVSSGRTRSRWWTENTTIFPCFQSHTKHALLQPDNLSVCRFSQWISQRTSRSVACALSTGWFASVEQGSPFIRSTHSSTWLTSTVPFISSASKQIPDITTCKSVQPDKLPAHKELWATEFKEKTKNNKTKHNVP